MQNFLRRGLIPTLSLWQPWASLMAIGAKRVETRGWGTRYRGPLAIHATATMTPDRAWLCTQPPFFDRLQASGLECPSELPFGAVLCVLRLDWCFATGQLSESAQGLFWPRGGVIAGDELAFGDYTPGRYGLGTCKLKPLTTPIKAKGAQGIWGWRPPENLPELLGCDLDYFKTGDASNEPPT